MDITPLCQRDVRWAGRLLGTSPLTIGDAGCLLCCVAMVANWAGDDVEPGELNALLRYVEGYESENLLRWYAVARVTPLRLEVLSSCPLTPAPLEDIGRHLDAGRPVIAQVQRPGTEHWVLLVGRWEYVDPWDGETKVMVDPAREILGWAVYARREN